VVCDYDTDVTVTCVAYSDMLLAGETHHAEIARHYGVGAGIYSGNPSYYCQALLESS
jgi:GH25 family lysozyme M1 (1,4-beta-N-acetylmuramidase)